MATGRIAASFLAFLVAALTIMLLMFGLAFIIGTAQERLVERLKASTPTVKRWGAYILVSVGVWFIILGFFANYFATVFPV